MKIALVSYDQWQGKSTGLYPPLHLCILATALNSAGHEVKVFDYAYSFSQIDVLFKEVQSFKPDVVGGTCFTRWIADFNKITKNLRKYVPDSAMVVGGCHPTAWPKWALDSEPCVTFSIEAC